MNALDWERVAATSRKVRELLWEHSPELVSAAEGFAKEVMYVPVSATGCPPVADKSGAIQGIRVRDVKPKWVEVPLLMVLARWSKGLIPYSARKSAANGGGKG
jgi:hypothetical protein